MTREEILEAVREVVRRTGRVPGRAVFENESGVGRHEWYGRYWARWGDVLVEAGFPPNSKTAAADRNTVAAAYLRWVEEFGRLPTEGELRVKNHEDSSFPGRQAIRTALGLKSQRLRTLLDCAVATGSSPTTVRLLETAVKELPEPSAEADATTDDAAPLDGYVYLLKSGKHYKIGRTNSLDRRQYEIGIQLPETLEPVHSIKTDDPSGIEAYWHNRFRSKRMNGEWFKLTAEDVRAFRRRKYM